MRHASSLSRQHVLLRTQGGQALQNATRADLGAIRQLSSDAAPAAESGLGAGAGAQEETRDKVLVIGGSGFVGASVCRAALDLGATHVVSLSRSGLTPGLKALGQGWVDRVEWAQGDVFQPQQWESLLPSTAAVVSCVGAFGTREQMLRVNGEANVLAAQAAAQAGVPRFVFISAHDFGAVGRIIPAGYYEGKRAAEAAVLAEFPQTGTVLYPGMIHGPRIVGSYTLPLQLVGAPLQLVFSTLPWLEKLPLLGPAMVPPVPVAAVGRAAVKAALGLAGDKQRLSVADILRLGASA